MKFGWWPREMGRFFLVPWMHLATLHLASLDGARPHPYFAWGCFRNFGSGSAVLRVRDTTADASRRREAIQLQAIMLWQQGFHGLAPTSGSRRVSRAFAETFRLTIVDAQRSDIAAFNLFAERLDQFRHFFEERIDRERLTERIERAFVVA